jgi:putative membrane protein
VAGLVLSILLNIVRVVLTDWDLTVTATPGGLVRRSGLLSTTRVATSLPRVQRVTIRQGVLERWADLRSVDLNTVGSVSLTIPGCTAAEAEELRGKGLDGSAGVAELERRVSPLNVFVATRNSALLAVLGAVPLAFLVGPWAMLTFVQVPFAWGAARRRTRLRRWGVSPEAIADHQELFGWSDHEMLLRKVNGIRVRQSLFERRRGLATVRLDSAAGSISLGMIGLHEAESLRDLVLASVETDQRSWM